MVVVPIERNNDRLNSFVVVVVVVTVVGGFAVLVVERSAGTAKR